jgi:hypothetical protein
MIKIRSYYSTGSNYLRELIRLNFPEFQNQLDKSHNLPDIREFINHLDEDKYLYIWRNKHDVIKSLWNRRLLLGWTNCKTFQEFNNKKVSELFVPTTVKIKMIMLHETLLDDKFKIGRRDEFLWDKTISEGYDYHYQCWKKYSKLRNVLMFSYEFLMDHFDETMLRIAKHIGSDKTEFENFTKKVGYYVQTD